MKLFDLKNLIDQQYFLETLSNKLDSTFIKHGGKHVFVNCSWGDEGYDEETDCHSSHLDVYGTDVNESSFSISIEALYNYEVDFIWPEAGYYDFMRDDVLNHVSIRYGTEYSWKAGLPEKLLVTSFAKGLGSKKQHCAMLDTRMTPDRTLVEALDIINTEGSPDACPLNSDIAVSDIGSTIPKVYTNSFNNSNGGVCIGSVFDDKIKLTGDNKFYSELLEHLEVPYVC